MIDYSEITNGILAVVEKEDVITERLNCQNRSIKMLVGHMIDSANNNQQRMVRLQDYQHEDWSTLVQLWRCANLHIIQVIKSVDQSKLDNYWLDFEGNQVTLDAMIRGYIGHLELHVGQIHELLDCPSGKKRHW